MEEDVEKEVLPVHPKAPETAFPEVEALKAELAALKAQVAALGQASRVPWSIPDPDKIIPWCWANEAHNKSAGYVLDYWPKDKDYPARGGRLDKGGGWRPPEDHIAKVLRAMKEEYERGAG